MKKLDEREIIGIFASTLGLSSHHISRSKNGKSLTDGLDDVAVIDPSWMPKKEGAITVFKSDMLVESTDVPCIGEAMQPWQMARKSMVSCVSDLAAKGTRPVAAMISIGLPKDYCNRAFVKGLANGFKKASDEFGVRIVGGDTNEAKELVIDCSMIGSVIPHNGNKKMEIPLRNGADPGDVVVVSGMFGYPPSGLKILMQNAKACGKFKRLAIKSVTMPSPRQDFGVGLARYFSSSIDSSDGLAISLYELATHSNVDILIDSIPYADGVLEFAKENKIDANELVFHGGEEYEIVATIHESDVIKAKGAAKRLGIAFYKIGKVRMREEAQGQVFVMGADDCDDGKNRRKSRLANRGYIHFENGGQ